MVKSDEAIGDSHEDATPERRALNHGRDLAAIEAARSRPIGALFTQRELRDGRLVPVKTWERDVGVLVERNVENEGGRGDFIVFKGDPSGRDAFYLGGNLRGKARSAGPDDKWTIHDGGGRRYGYEVRFADVAAFVELDDRRHEREVAGMVATHRPFDYTLWGNVLDGGRITPDSETRLVSARVDRDHATGRDTLRVSSADGTTHLVLDDERRRELRELAAGRPGAPFAYDPEGREGMVALKASGVAEVIARSDRDHARDLREVAESIQAEHALPVVGSRETLTAAVAGKGEAAELLIVGEGFAARSRIDAATLSGIAAAGDAKVLAVSSVEREAAREVATRHVRAGDLKRVLAHEGFGERRDRPFNEATVGTVRAADLARVLVDELPLRSRERGGREVVGVHVAKDDLLSALGRDDGKGGRIGEAGYGDALNFVIEAIRQPVYKDFKPTGEVREGVAGLRLLLDGFGSGSQRTLWLDPGKVAEAVASPEGVRGLRPFRPNEGQALFGALKEGSGKRGEAAGPRGRPPVAKAVKARGADAGR